MTRKKALLRSRIALIAILVCAGAGCQNGAKVSEVESLRTTVLQLQATNSSLINQVSNQQRIIAEQQRANTELNADPRKGSWYMKFVDWLTAIFGSFLANQFVQWVLRFLGLG